MAPRKARAGSDSEDDFKPTKAKAAARVKAPAKPKPVVEKDNKQSKLDAFVKVNGNGTVKRGR